jgi:MFS family permease
MFVVIQKLGVFILGALIGALFGYWAFVVQDEAWYRFDWRKFVLPPALLVGTLSLWLGDKPIKGTWYSILGGICAGGVSGTIAGIAVAISFEELSNFDREVRGLIGFCAVVAGLPLGMLIGGAIGGKLGKRHQETRPD